MHSHEILREVLRHLSAKQVAAELGLSLSTIYKWAEPDCGPTGSGAPNPLDRVAALQRATRDPRIPQWLCQQAGGFFIPNPTHLAPHPDSLVPSLNQVVQDFADLLSAIAAAAADHQITAPEAPVIRQRWEQLKAVTETFVLSCEQGSFAPSPQPLHLGAHHPPHHRHGL